MNLSYGNHSSYTDSEPLGDELATNDDLPSSDKLMTNDDLLFTDEQTPTVTGLVTAANKNEADEAKFSTDSIDTSDISEVSAVSEDFDHFEVNHPCNCMGKDNLLKLHETLVHVYGMKQGQTIYKTIKDKSYSFTPEKLAPVKERR